MPDTKHPVHNTYWVKPNEFMAGEYPGRHTEEETRQRIDSFLDAGLNTFIDLTMPGELVPYEPILREQAGYYQIDVQYHRFSIGDFGTPSLQNMRTILNTITQALKKDRKVYVHCWAGIGRTGTTVGCYLIEQGLSGEQALQQVNEWCHYARSPETEKQKLFIRSWQ